MKPMYTTDNEVVDVNGKTHKVRINPETFQPEMLVDGEWKGVEPAKRDKEQGK